MIGRVYLGRYEAFRLLGEGGMGKVYLARQLDLGRQVVVKVMHDEIAQDKSFRDRFVRETMLMARFLHPYAVTLFDASVNDPSEPCIVMEYVRGVTLEALLKSNGRLSPGRVGRMLAQLCDVLQAAHADGMIHRDLKPPNLMLLDHDTPREKLKVMDFGLAKLTYDSKAIKNVTEGSVDGLIGTPKYISPEQARGESLDHRSDLYSVGVIIYELLTGRVPFHGRSGMDLVLAHAMETPPSFESLELDIEIPATVEQAVFAILEKDPKNRPQSALELYEAYETALVGNKKKQSPKQAPAEAPPEAKPPVHADPTALSFQLEAWMPESIASIKLRGFAQDIRGEILESVPGLIRLRIGGSTITKSSWFGPNRRSGAATAIDMELHLHQIDPQRSNRLFIEVVFRPHTINQLQDPAWRDRCGRLQTELRAYLMGANMSSGSGR